LNQHQFNYKHVGIILLPAVAVAIITVISLTSASQTNATVETPIQGVHFKTSIGNNADFHEGKINHYLWQVSPKSATYVKRGTNVLIPVVIGFASRIPGDSATLTNFHSVGRAFAPGAIAGLTDAEFDERISQGVPMSGEIPFKDYLTVSPASVKIAANSSATIYVEVSIPSNYPDIMLHNDLPIAIGWDTTIPSWDAPITDANADVVVEP
jgi:hypothetical protein